MKKNDIKKLKESKTADLQKEVAEARESLRTLKFDFAAGKVKNVGLINETKKKIARMLTFIRLNILENQNNEHGK